MLFSKLFTVAALAASATAQALLAFTSTPGSSVTAGVPVTIRWTGGTGGPVTITLKKGRPTDLKTVAVLTGMYHICDYDRKNIRKQIDLP